MPRKGERGQIIILDLLVRECNLILKSNFLLNTLRSVFVVIPAPVLGATHFAFTNLNGDRQERVTRWQLQAEMKSNGAKVIFANSQLYKKAHQEVM
jgi:hypothetical protein